jgi:hypothetical protein
MAKSRACQLPLLSQMNLRWMPVTQPIQHIVQNDGFAVDMYQSKSAGGAS